MAKIYGVHTISLRLGASAEEFERFVNEEVNGMSMYDGWKLMVLKGDRGDRVGRFLVLFEIDDVASRDRYAPADGSTTPETERFLQNHPELQTIAERWSQFATPFWEGIDAATDYAVIAESR
jgi:hypothetical protein